MLQASLIGRGAVAAASMSAGGKASVGLQKLSVRAWDPIAPPLIKKVVLPQHRMAATSSRGAFAFANVAARRTPPLPTAMAFSGPLRLTNAFQPRVNTMLRTATAGKNGLGIHARHHQSSYRTQMFHSRRRKSFQATGEMVVAGLITANVAVTMMWITAHSQRKKRRMMTHFTTSTMHLARGQYHTLLTSVFSHADLGHLLANMIGLFFFGRQICDVLGPKRFLALYLGSGVLSSWAAVYEQQHSNRMTFNLGASGAVNSITALSILLFPHSTLLIFGIIPMPAWLAGSMFIFKDAYSWATDRRDGIGHFAHLSGAFCGGAYYYYLRRNGGLRFFR
ncbi:Serine protease family s54, partial [Globisporangium splendens]